MSELYSNTVATENDSEALPNPFKKKMKLQPVVYTRILTLGGRMLIKDEH